MRRSCPSLRTGAAVLLGVIASFCSPLPEEGPSTGLSATEREITYALTWTWGDAAPMGDHWQVVNDLGYTVVVTQGYLVSYSMELVACDPEIRLDALLWEWFGPRRAYAGHGDAPSPETLERPRVESLTTPTGVEAGVVVVPQARYCRAHYLIARAGGDTLGLPEDDDLVGLSAVLEGHFQEPGALSETLFSLRTNLANGLLIDIGPIEADTGDLVVTIERDLSALFDGVDFVQMTEREREFQLLRQLIDSSTISIEGGS